MNSARMSISRKVHVSINGSQWLLCCLLLVCTDVIGSTPAYENFTLPPSKNRAVLPVSKVNYKTSSFRLEGSSRQKKGPSVDHDTFLFSKQMFLAERREQAIKLLRQEIDAGYKANLPNMLLRLGQLYAEKYQELSYLENKLHDEKLKDWEQKGKKGRAPRLDERRSKSYLTRALKTFYALEKKYPRHPKIDEVLFFIGFVEIEAGRGRRGAQYLERVVRKFPRSRKYDEAVVYLGDYYFDRSKFKTAAAKYSILLRRGVARLSNYARYKLAWCHLNMRQSTRALAEMKSLIEKLEGSEGEDFNLRKQAMNDMVVFYGEVGRAKEAFEFFKDNGMDEKDAIKNVRLIADILRSKARDEEAIAAYELLLDEDDESPDAPLIQLAIYKSLSRMGRTKQGVTHLGKALQNYGASSDFAEDFPEDKKEELKAILSELQSEGFKAATYHHRAAQKGRNRVNYAYALHIYDSLLKGFPSHPERKRVMFYKGEIAFEQKKWLEASEAYLAASKIAPKDKLTDEAVYNALLALDQVTQKREKLVRFNADEMRNKDFDKKDIPKDELRFIELAQYYMKEYPKGLRAADVRFRIASIYYAHYHFDRALEGFKFVALKHPKHRSARTSAYLVLDIYNIKKDYESLEQYSRKFAATKGLATRQFREEALQLRDEIRFKKIERFEKENKWTKAGDSYLEVYKSNPNGKLAQQSLYNALVSFEKSDNKGKTDDVRKLFVKRYPKSPYVKNITLKLAKDAEGRYDFDESRKLFQKYYENFPRDKEAPKALYNAAVFSELLEENRTSLALYELYLKKYRPEKDERESIYISMGKLNRKLGRWDEVNKIYRRLKAWHPSDSDKVKYLGELARQFELGGRISQKKTVAKELAWYYTNRKGTKFTGTALKYVAENMFEQASRYRKRFDEIKLRFPPNDLVYLMKRKQGRLDQLAKAYDQVIDVGVPEWGVAATLEKGDAYLRFVESYRTVKIPGRYNAAQKKEAMAALKQIDAEAVAPVEKAGREILVKCVEKSKEFTVSSRYANRCFDRVAEFQKGKEFTPAGMIPRPGYWSTHPLKSEVVLR